MNNILKENNLKLKSSKNNFEYDKEKVNSAINK
mgnify:CR=1 FL=1